MDGHVKSANSKYAKADAAIERESSDDNFQRWHNAVAGTISPKM